MIGSIAAGFVVGGLIGVLGGLVSGVLVTIGLVVAEGMFSFVGHEYYVNNFILEDALGTSDCRCLV